MYYIAVPLIRHIIKQSFIFIIISRVQKVNYLSIHWSSAILACAARDTGPTTNKINYIGDTSLICV